MKKPLVTAHTGCNDTPHNTIESVLAGARWGADISEIDVRSTSDGIPILWHNDVLETISRGFLRVESLTYREILSLENQGELKFSHRAGKITSLEEILEAVKDQNILLNLDLKDDECIVPVSKIVKERDVADKVIFSGCEKVRASYLKSNYPEFQVLLNAEERLFNRIDFTYSEKIRILCDTAISAGCCGLNISFDYCRTELIDYADCRFLPVAVWTVSPEDGFELFIDMGVSSISTLHVKELVEIKRIRQKE